MRRFVCVLTVIALLVSGVSALGEGTLEKTEQNQMIEDMILYYGCYGEEAAEEIDGLLEALKKTDARQGKLWEDIMNYWRYVNADAVINDERLPDNLPKDDSFALVILGLKLKADGSMEDELILRLKAGLECAEQYPNAYVVCTGGGTAEDNHDVTEAGQMGAWLLENGLAEDRLILEDKSLTTIENARFTLDLLHRDCPQVDALAIVSSDYHVKRGCLLFEATALMMMNENQVPKAEVVSNFASPAPEKHFTEEYLLGWQMYNMLQFIGNRKLARQYIVDPNHFPRPVLHGRNDIPDAA